MAEGDNSFIELMGMLYSFVGYLISTFIFSITYISYIIITIITTFFSYTVIVKDIFFSIISMIETALGFVGYIFSFLTFFFNIVDNTDENLF